VPAPARATTTPSTITRLIAPRLVDRLRPSLRPTGVSSPLPPRKVKKPGSAGRPQGLKVAATPAARATTGRLIELNSPGCKIWFQKNTSAPTTMTRSTTPAPTFDINPVVALVLVLISYDAPGDAAIWMYGCQSRILPIQHSSS
jgi:hypothetical protein